MPHAVIVEDDERTRFALSEFTERLGYTTTTAASFSEARSELERGCPAVVLLDMYLPGGSGIDLLLEMPSPRPHVLLMSGDESIQRAVERMSLQTVHFLRKPIELPVLTKVLESVRKKAPIVERDGRTKPRTSRLIGQSPAILELRRLIERVAPTDFPVYIEGESGSGKELVAEAVHLQSRRRDRSFVAINCGALPESLIDSEVFGHERGAFTGAAAVKQGVFEQADGGTLFLDEIAEMALELQVRLLRVLETGKVKRVGGTKEIDVDVRVIAATNRPATLTLREGKLREDLYHRLSMFPIQIPPLRSRPGDIPLLVDYFLAEIEKAEGKGKRLDPLTLDALTRYHWPGNVRQLRNVVHRAYIMADDHIVPSCLLPQIRAESVASATATMRATAGEDGVSLTVGTTLADAERRLIEATLENQGGDKRAAAEVLGISLRTLYSRLREYGAASEDSEQA